MVFMDLLAHFLHEPTVYLRVYVEKMGSLKAYLQKVGKKVKDEDKKK